MKRRASEGGAHLKCVRPLARSTFKDACYLNLGGPMYYVGLDLHKKYITGCALDSQGAVVATERRLPPVLETVLGWLAPVGQPAAVALEATLYWAWLHDRLTAAGYQVAVAHPQQVKLICHARCKTDPVCPQVGRPAAHGSPPGDLDPGCRDAGAADVAARAGLGGANADAGQGPHPGVSRGGERAGAGKRPVQPRRPGVARDGGVATGGAPAGRSAGGFGGAPRCPDCRTRSGSAGARPGDSRGRAAADDSGDRAVWGALAARRDRNDRPVWFESRAGGVCGAGAEHAELGREDGPWVGRPRGECVAQVAVRRSGADAEAAARPGAQPVRAVAAGQGEAEGDRGGGAQALLLRLLDDEGRAEL